MERYPRLSSFALAFAKEYKAFMVATDVSGQDLSKKLGRSVAYVSERINGKRALDTEDVDALAMLAGDGWTGRTLVIELARRAREAGGEAEIDPSDAPIVPVTNLHSEPVDDDLRAAASDYSDDRGEDGDYDA